METGANDVLVVRDDTRERLLPFIRQVVVSVDVEQGRIVADWDPEF
jgi:16S rRNA processing protein RimM